MALKTALSRGRRKTPAINNPTSGLVWPRIWVTLKNYPKHWKNNPKKWPKKLNPAFGLKK